MSLADTLRTVMGEFRDRYAGRYFGSWRGMVVSIDDPKQLGRVKVQCPALLRDTPQYREWWLNCNYECNTKGPNSMAPQDCDPQEPASGPRSDNKADR